MKTREKLTSFLKIRKLQVTLLLIGIVVTLIGAVFLMSYWSDTSNNLGTVGTIIHAGWSSNNVTNARLKTWIAPNFFGKDDNLLEVSLWGIINANSDADNATFVLLVPFNVKSIMGQSNDSFLASGDWSVQNIGLNASAIYYKLEPSTNNSSVPHSDFIDTVVDFRFAHLTSLDNHGSYTVVFPFGEGNTLSALEATNFTSLPLNLDKNMTFGVLMTGNLALTSSYPNYVSQDINYGLPFHYSDESGSMLCFYYDTTSPLTVTFQDIDEINSSSQNQALAFTFLGVGIPIVIGAFVEVVEKKTE